MKWVREEALLRRGAFPDSDEMRDIRQELAAAVRAAVWPLTGDDFAIKPVKHENGVVPIKGEVMRTLKRRFGWQLEFPSTIGTKGGRATGEIDAVRRLKDGRLFAVEWETGNISSSHRSVNKMSLGLLQNVLVGGALILPSRGLYPYLTDRIGSYEELAPYFDLWRHLIVDEGYLAVISVEHDRTDMRVPKIPKGTDGRAKR